MKIFTILDSKAKAYMTPFFQKNEDVAVRVLEQACNEQGHIFNTNPEDFSLFQIGIFNEDTGEIVPHPPEHIVNMKMLIKAPIWTLDEETEG